MKKFLRLENTLYLILTNINCDFMYNIKIIPKSYLKTTNGNNKVVVKIDFQ